MEELSIDKDKMLCYHQDRDISFYSTHKVLADFFGLSAEREGYVHDDHELGQEAEVLCSTTLGCLSFLLDKKGFNPNNPRLLILQDEKRERRGVTERTSYDFLLKALFIAESIHL